MAPRCLSLFVFFLRHLLFNPRYQEVLKKKETSLDHPMINYVNFYSEMCPHPSPPPHQRLPVSSSFTKIDCGKVRSPRLPRVIAPCDLAATNARPSPDGIPLHSPTFPHVDFCQTSLSFFEAGVQNSPRSRITSITKFRCFAGSIGHRLQAAIAPRHWLVTALCQHKALCPLSEYKLKGKKHLKTEMFAGMLWQPHDRSRQIWVGAGEG